jgi:hypothetical protein
VCKRWQQLCSAHADTHRKLAIVVVEATQRDWVHAWLKVRAPHATSVSIQALCMQHRELEVRVCLKSSRVVTRVHPVRDPCFTALATLRCSAWYATCLLVPSAG